MEGSQNRVSGNYFGLTATGYSLAPNGQYGIHIAPGAGDNLIGGSNTDHRNVISGNTLSGMLIEGSGNVATGNYVGFGADCSTALGNSQHGILIAAGAAGNRIGGTAWREWNFIGHNGGSGVAVSGSDNAIIACCIFNNSGLGIDLLGGIQNGFGVTANDPGDVDSGPNELLNYPEITWAGERSGTITINYDLDVPAGNYRVDFYKNPSGFDISGYGEGQQHATATTITHPGGGLRSFSLNMSGSAGDIITTTTTVDAGGGLFRATSEFSAAYSVLALPDIGLSKSFNLVSDPVNGSTEPKLIPGAIIEYALTVSNQGAGAADSDTVITTNAVPVETALFVGDIAGAGSGPVQFIDGSIASGLTFNFNSLNSTTDSVSFSSDNDASYIPISPPRMELAATGWLPIFA